MANSNKIKLNPSDFAVLLPKDDTDSKGEWEWDEYDYDIEDEGEWEPCDESEAEGEIKTEGGTDTKSGTDLSEPTDLADDENVKTVMEQNDELAESEIHETVKTFEDVDPFGGMKGELPTVSMETTDELLSGLRDDAEASELHYHAEGKELPYTPNPTAQAKDYVVVYDDQDPIYQHEARSVRSAIGTMSRTIAGQLRRILHSSSLNRVQRDQRRGKLDRSKLHTLNRPGTLQPNRRVFTTQIQGKSHDIAIGLLVDQSGSMGGSKIRCAREAATALADALDQLTPLGVKFGVWGFDSDYKGRAKAMKDTDRSEPLRFHQYKNVDESWRRVSSRIGAMEARDNNCDGESVRWAANQLLAVDNVSRRILIVLSDGSPCCATSLSYHRIAADLKSAVTEMNDLGVETFGLGIMDSSVKEFYPDHAVIHSARELETTLMDRLRQMLLGTKSRAA